MNPILFRTAYAIGADYERYFILHYLYNHRNLDNLLLLERLIDNQHRKPENQPNKGYTYIVGMIQGEIYHHNNVGNDYY